MGDAIVYDGLDIDSQFDALSANQGRILHGMITNISIWQSRHLIQYFL